jgi:hypothetical protein
MTRFHDFYRVPANGACGYFVSGSRPLDFGERSNALLRFIQQFRRSLENCFPVSLLAFLKSADGCHDDVQKFVLEVQLDEIRDRSDARRRRTDISYPMRTLAPVLIRSACPLARESSEWMQPAAMWTISESVVQGSGVDLT